MYHTNYRGKCSFSVPSSADVGSIVLIRDKIVTLILLPTYLLGGMLLVVTVGLSVCSQDLTIYTFFLIISLLPIKETNQIKLANETFAFS